MRYLIYVVFFLLAVCLAADAQAGPLRRLAGCLFGGGRSGKATVSNEPQQAHFQGNCDSGNCNTGFFGRPRLFGR